MGSVIEIWMYVLRPGAFPDSLKLPPASHGLLLVSRGQMPHSAAGRASSLSCRPVNPHADAQSCKGAKLRPRWGRRACRPAEWVAAAPC